MTKNEIAAGALVHCNCPDARHTGKVVRVLVPGVFVGVAWDGFVVAPTPRSPEAKAMRDLAKAHNIAMTAVTELKVA